jgi:anti-sigma factor RsiW
VRSSEPTKLNCADLASALERRWDGELPSIEVEALESHLSQCTACASRATSDDRLRATLRSADRSARVLPTGAEWTRRVAAQDRGFQQGRRALGIGGLSLAGATLVFALFFRDTLPQSTSSPDLRPGITQSVAAPTPLPALLVIDDEEGGRQVFQSATRTE